MRFLDFFKFNKWELDNFYKLKKIEKTQYEIIDNFIFNVKDGYYKIKYFNWSIDFFLEDIFKDVSKEKVVLEFSFVNSDGIPKDFELSFAKNNTKIKIKDKKHIKFFVDMYYKGKYEFEIRKNDELIQKLEEVNKNLNNNKRLSRKNKISNL